MRKKKHIPYFIHFHLRCYLHYVSLGVPKKSKTKNQNFQKSKQKRNFALSYRFVSARYKYAIQRIELDM